MRYMILVKARQRSWDGHHTDLNSLVLILDTPIEDPCKKHSLKVPDPCTKEPQKSRSVGLSQTFEFVCYFFQLCLHACMPQVSCKST